jgi:hypothetical protein
MDTHKETSSIKGIVGVVTGRDGHTLGTVFAAQ